MKPGGDCPKCNTRNDYTAKNCTMCGELLPWAQQQPAATPPAAAPSTAPYAYPMRGEYAGKGGEIRLIKDLGRGSWFAFKVIGIVIGAIFAFSFVVALILTILT